MINVFQNCISIYVATVSKMTVSHMYKSLVFGDECVALVVELRSIFRLLSLVCECARYTRL